MPERDYSQRSTVAKLGIGPGQRVEIAGRIGPQLRQEIMTATARPLTRRGELDAAVVLIESLTRGGEIFAKWGARLRDAGCLWIVIHKRGHPRYINQMDLVPVAKTFGLIDNKVCSIDAELSAIRFVMPLDLRDKR